MTEKSEKESLMEAVLFDAIGVVLPTQTMQTALDNYRLKKIRAARDIWIEEIGSGAIAPEDVNDDLLALLERWTRAVAEGVAIANLRLMLRVVKGQWRLDRCFNPHEFQHFTNIIESLTEQEIVLLGTLYRGWLAAPENERQNRWDRIWKDAEKELVEDRRLFESANDLQASANALQRTGLFVVQNNVWEIGSLVFSNRIDRFGAVLSLDQSI